MKKITKNDRLTYIVKILTENPKKIFTLNHFGEILDCAKSTLSEDIDYIKKIFRELNLGEIETIPGAAGGIQYKPIISQEEARRFCDELCQDINHADRLIPGGYIYMNDIFYSPDRINTLARIFATPYFDKELDYVVTIETKGIPIAMMTAKMLNKPMIVVRKSAKLSEGTTIQTNYVTSSGRIEALALAKRAINRGSKVLFIDDFMKAGGTAKAVVDLMKEFEAEVIGTGIVLTMAHPNKKLIKDYNTILVVESIDFEEGFINIRPNDDTISQLRESNI